MKCKHIKTQLKPCDCFLFAFEIMKAELNLSKTMVNSRGLKLSGVT